MIDSPEQQFDDIQFSVCDEESKKVVFFTHRPKNEVVKNTQNLVRANAIVSYFARMAWVNKFRFLNCLFNKIKDLGSFTLLLNTLQTLRGKVTSYWRSSNSTPTDYDRQLHDHDRMLEKEMLTEVVRRDLQWFETLEDKEQTALIITIIRSGGGALTREVYERLQIVYVHRLHEIPISTISVHQPKLSQSKEVKSVALEQQHDPEDPKHQKVLQLTEEFNATMAKLKKNVQKMQPKEKIPKEKKDGEKKKKKSDSSKSKKSDKKKKKKKGKKKKKKNGDDPLDWIQLTPIPIVKKIFNFLDAPSLKKAKQVNAYWKWAVEEFSKDKKVSKILQKTKDQLKTDSGCDRKSPDCECEIEPKPRISHTEKRIQKLKNRGAVIEELRFKNLPTSDTYSLVIEALKKTGVKLPHFENLTMYPRVPRSTSPLYKKPRYIVKDYKIITEEVEGSLESDDNIAMSFVSCSMMSRSHADDE